MTNYDIEHVIKKEMSGDVRDAFVAIGNWQAPGEGAGALLRLWAGSLEECNLSIILGTKHLLRSPLLPKCDCRGQPEDIFKALGVG